MSTNSAPGVLFTIPTRLIAVILLLAPVFAQAKSEYRACMEAQQRMASPFAGYSAARSFGAFSSSAWSRASSAGYYANGYPGSYYYASNFSISFSGMESLQANRVSAMARHCRQFRKENPPNFRVVTVKSHSLRPAVNGKR